MDITEKFQVIQKGVVFEFEPAEEGGYVVNVPAAPGCWSQGESFEEALAMIQDALGGWLVVAHAEGLEVPKGLDAFLPANARS